MTNLGKIYKKELTGDSEGWLLDDDTPDKIRGKLLLFGGIYYYHEVFHYPHTGEDHTITTKYVSEWNGFKDRQALFIQDYQDAFEEIHLGNFLSKV